MDCQETNRNEVTIKVLHSINNTKKKIKKKKKKKKQKKKKT